MAINIIDQFDVGAGVPLDSRCMQASRNDILAIPVSQRYQGMIVYSSDTGTPYIFKNGIADANLVELIPSIASSTSSGLMSAADKVKLDGISGSGSLVSATSAYLELYVSLSGSDDNDGSVQNPFRTLQKAIESIPTIINHGVSINIYGDCCSGNIDITNKVGSGAIHINLNSYTYNDASIFINSVRVPVEFYDGTINLTYLNQYTSPVEIGYSSMVYFAANVTLNTVSARTYFNIVGSTVHVASTFVFDDDPGAQLFLLSDSSVLNARNAVFQHGFSVSCYRLSKAMFDACTIPADISRSSDQSSEITVIGTDDTLSSHRINTSRHVSTADRIRWDTASSSGSGVGSMSATTNNMHIFVSSTGSDANDGSMMSPYLTIQKAISTVPMFVNHMVFINAMDDCFNGLLAIGGRLGSGMLVINLSNYTYNDAYVAIENTKIPVIMQSGTLNLSTIGPAPIQVNASYMLQLYGVTLNIPSQCTSCFKITMSTFVGSVAAVHTHTPLMFEVDGTSTAFVLMSQFTNDFSVKCSNLSKTLFDLCTMPTLVTRECDASSEITIVGIDDTLTSHRNNESKHVSAADRIRWDAAPPTVDEEALKRFAVAMAIALG